MAADYMWFLAYFCIVLIIIVQPVESLSAADTISGNICKDSTNFDGLIDCFDSLNVKICPSVYPASSVLLWARQSAVPYRPRPHC
jgi:hypothetical protein